MSISAGRPASKAPSEPRQTYQWLIRTCVTLAPKSAAGSILVGLLVLLGYGLEWPRLWRPLVGGPATNPWTALCLVALGSAILTVHPRRRSNVGAALAALAGAIAVARLALTAAGQEDAFQHFLLSRRIVAIEALEGQTSNAMGLNTTAMIALMAAAIICFRLHRVAASQIVSALAALPPIVALIGYAYGISGFYGSMGWLTLVGYLLCAASMLLRTAYQPPLRNFLTVDVAGRLARYQVMVLVAPCLLMGFVAARFQLEIGSKALPIVATAVVVIIIWALGEAAYHSSRMGRWRSSTPPVNESLLDRALRGAWDRQELFLLYQPQIELATKRIVGVEALVRWRHPDQGLLSPAEFIPAAEASGLIVPLGTWVLRTACQEAVRWRDGAMAGAAISVNVSSLQISQPGFAETVMEIIRSTGLAPRRLVLEVTESVMVQRANHGLQALRDLHAAEVHIALDDFGTGYSSLSYLRMLPSDHLKIDQSFVHELPGEEGAAAIARAIVAMGKSLGMRVVAEGIETEEQADFLQSIWCDEGQGYLYARPMTAADMLSWAAAWTSRIRDNKNKTADSRSSHG